jgi:hypothetical protein
MKERVKTLIEKMTTEELRTRLAEYMNADIRLMSPLVAVAVKPYKKYNVRCRYDVVLIDEEGRETSVEFDGRYSKLMYIYTLLQPKGYQRYMLERDNYLVLRRLFNLLFLCEDDVLLKSIKRGDMHERGQFFSQNISRSRNAIRTASPFAESFVINDPRSHNGWALIPFVAQGGKVIIDESIMNVMSKFN